MGMNFILAIVLLVLATAGVVIRKTYFYLPLRELKRQATKSGTLAAHLYPTVAYGSSLSALLWIFIALTSAGGFILLARSLPTWLSVVALLVLLWIAYSWLPSSRVTKFGTRLTSLVNPVILWLLGHLHPLFSHTIGRAEHRITTPQHTGLFERTDLLELIDQQQQQIDNRLSVEELEVAKRALSFDEHTVSEMIIPRQQIKTVLADETVGPILIDEIHQSGQPFVLVRDSAKGPVIGSLETDQLGIQSKGQVRDLMNSTVYYVHENDSLAEALHAFFVTNHPMFVVINSFEEFVGIVTVEGLLKALLGHVPGDDFDQYSDLAAVAARHPRVKKSKAKAETADKTDQKMVE
jgi:CBS domain containing-hemolysin-like protein